MFIYNAIHDLILANFPIKVFFRESFEVESITILSHMISHYASQQ